MLLINSYLLDNNNLNNHDHNNNNNNHDHNHDSVFDVVDPASVGRQPALPQPTTLLW